MIVKFHERLRKFASKRVIVIWVVVVLVFFGGFQVLYNVLGKENAAPDIRFNYDPKYVADTFKAWGEKGRNWYALSAVTLDLAFPLIYGSLIVALLAHCFEVRWWHWLVFVPLFTVLSDFIENGTLAYLATIYEDKESPLAKVAAFGTKVKFIGFIVSGLLIVGGAIRMWSCQKSKEVP